MMKFFLLFILSLAIKSEKCDKTIVETYGLLSLIEPSKQNLVFCPNIKSSCCPDYEQFKMFLNYQNEVKPHYIRMTNLIKSQLDRLNKAIEPLFDGKGVLKDKIKTIKKISYRRQAEYLFTKLKGQSFGYYIEKAKLRLNRALTYTSSLKSTFFCTICDYQSQQYIDLKKGTVQITDDTCDEIVQHTLMYSNIINRGIVSFLQDLSFIISKVDKRHKHIQLPGFDELTAALNECTQEFKETEEDLSSCKKYCSYFRLNSDLPVYEGYPEFFLNILVQIHLNFPSQEKPKRILEALIDIDNDLKNQTFESSKQRHHKIQQAMKIFDEGRILTETELFRDNLSVSSLRQKKMTTDPFDEEFTYPNFDDHIMENMLEIQKVLEAGEPEYLKKQIKKHYVKSYEPQIEDIEDDIIFKVAPDEKVQLEKLKSKFSFDGINLSKIIEQMNWDLQFHDIVLSLTGKSGNLSNELIDNDLLFFMNKVQNHDVKNFHYDNFIEFNDDKEFVLLDYKRSQKELEEMRQTKIKNQFEYTHNLLRQYKLENVDTIIKELEDKHISKLTAQAETKEQLEQQKLNDAEIKLHQLVRQQEKKISQEKDYQANKEFLQTILKKKGLKGVINDLKKTNQKTIEQQKSQQTSTNQKDQEGSKTNDKEQQQPQGTPNQQTTQQTSQTGQTKDENETKNTTDITNENNQ